MTAAHNLHTIYTIAHITPTYPPSLKELHDNQKVKKKANGDAGTPKTTIAVHQEERANNDLIFWEMLLFII